jgi:hypothetical protein
MVLMFHFPSKRMQQCCNVSACYHCVQNLLSFSLLFKNINIKIYRTIILPFFYVGVKTWLLTVREDHRLVVFENRVLRRIFGP